MRRLSSFFKLSKGNGAEGPLSPQDMLRVSPADRLRQREASPKEIRDGQSPAKGDRPLGSSFWEHRHLLFIITFILLAAIRLGLWLLPFRNLLKLLQKISKSNFLVPCEDKSQISVSKIVWAVNAASRYMPGGVKCLARALTTQVLMSYHGHTPELRIGVAKGHEGKLEAHAWIEYQGRVAIGNLPDLSRFIPLPSLKGVKL
ncbi:hypothetical protein NIES4073_34420 [Kalymmatonema gypsitolerans NIES-4073]|nr:hypothetical protein NIES4073_34420 [Scytonema sp. NIES-4073]